jgi:hypothetical protein
VLRHGLERIVGQQTSTAGRYLISTAETSEDANRKLCPEQQKCGRANNGSYSPVLARQQPGANDEDAAHAKNKQAHHSKIRDAPTDFLGELHRGERNQQERASGKCCPAKRCTPEEYWVLLCDHTMASIVV